MSPNPPASHEQPLRTPPPSIPPLHPPSSDRKRKRISEDIIVGNSTLKRTRRFPSSTPPLSQPKTSSLTSEEAFPSRQPQSSHSQEFQAPREVDIGNLSPNIEEESSLGSLASLCSIKGIDQCASFQRTFIRAPPPIDTVDHWVSNGNWPEQYFIQEYRMGSSLGRKRSVSASEGTEASATEIRYRSPQFSTLLNKSGIIMEPDPSVPPGQSCKELCKTLLDAEQDLPQDSLFEDEPLARYLR